MKRITPILIVLIFTLACVSTTPAPPASKPAAIATTADSDTPVSPDNITIAVPTVEPSPTPTLTPPPSRWYWSVDDTDGTKVIAVNQFGERHELGILDQADDRYTWVLSIDRERALLFTDLYNTLGIYYLTPDGMQKIALPSEPFYFNSEVSDTSRAIIAVHEDHVVFSYVTEEGSNVMPDRGPLFLIDLTALTMKEIDGTVSRGPYQNNQNWFHSSAEGRYLRYRNHDGNKMQIRELDMVSGDTRTLYASDGSSFGVYASPQGDLWYLRKDQLLIDMNGNQKKFTDESMSRRPLQDGRVMIYPRNCVDNCEIKVITPFGNEAELTYPFPWGIESGGYFTVLDQVLHDQSLLFMANPYADFRTPPSAVKDYPGLTAQDAPLFRLTPEGDPRLIGIYTGSISNDRRLALMRSTDQTSFFIYDVIEGRPLFDMPADPGVDFFDPVAYFLDTGVIVKLEGSVRDQKNVYRSFTHAFVTKTSTSLVWEDVHQEGVGCPDLLEDGTLICWLYRPDGENSSQGPYYYDLARIDPAAGTKTLLAEKVWLVEFIP